MLPAAASQMSGRPLDSRNVYVVQQGWLDRISKAGTIMIGLSLTVLVIIGMFVVGNDLKDTNKAAHSTTNVINKASNVVDSGYDLLGSKGIDLYKVLFDNIPTGTVEIEHVFARYLTAFHSLGEAIIFLQRSGAIQATGFILARFSDVVATDSAERMGYRIHEWFMNTTEGERGQQLSEDVLRTFHAVSLAVDDFAKAGGGKAIVAPINNVSASLDAFIDRLGRHGVKIELVAPEEP